MKIKCLEHGYFYQTPHNHLSGAGCPECGKIKISNKNSSNIEGFINKANNIHHNYYDYRLSKYNGCYQPLDIICPIHGVFQQTPRDHLQGCGCPICKLSKLEIEIFYLLKDNNVQFKLHYKWSWLKKQTVYFYLSDYNVAIECQGLQHFQPSNFGSKKHNKEDMLEYVQKLDEQKLILCKEHNIRLLYYSNLHIVYPYKVYEDKEELLKEIIKENV